MALKHYALRFGLSAAVVLTACGGGSGSASGFRGVALSSPIEKPAIVLSDVNGRPYHFVEETKDKVADAPGEDPDIAGIIPGPQPILDLDG